MTNQTHTSYSKNFIDELCREFGENSDIVNEAKMGHLMPVGKLLDDARQFDGTSTRISMMLYNGFAKELMREATKASRCEDLYTKWYAIYEEACKVPSNEIEQDNLEANLFGISHSGNYD